MKKIILSMGLLCALCLQAESPKVYTVNDKTNISSLDTLFRTIRQLRSLYEKTGDLSEKDCELIVKQSLGNQTEEEFKKKLNEEGKKFNIDFALHKDMFSFPEIKMPLVVKTYSSSFSMEQQTIILAITPILNKFLYSILYGKFLLVKLKDKHVIVFGTENKESAIKAALNIKEAIEEWKNTIPASIKNFLGVFLFSLVLQDIVTKK